MKERGYIEGRTIAIEYRYAEGKLDRLPGLAGELVRLKVDLVVASGPGAEAAKNATIKTAKALGLTILQSVLLRADEIIQ